MTASTPKKEILSEIARELAMPAYTVIIWNGDHSSSKNVQELSR